MEALLAVDGLEGWERRDRAPPAPARPPGPLGHPGSLGHTIRDRPTRRRPRAIHKHCPRMSSPRSPRPAPTRSACAPTAASRSSACGFRRTASTGMRRARSRSRWSATRTRPQWFPALRRPSHGATHWRVVTFTKVACPFLDMRVTTSPSSASTGSARSSGTRTIARLQRLQPDLVMVSMSRFAIHPVRTKDLPWHPVSMRWLGSSRCSRTGRPARRHARRAEGRPFLPVAARRDVLRCSFPLRRRSSGSLAGWNDSRAGRPGRPVIDLRGRVCRATRVRSSWTA